MAKALNAQAAAAYAVAQIIKNGRSLSQTLPEAIGRLQHPKDQALTQELCYGSLRWWPRLTLIISQLLQKPLKPKDQDIHALLIIGLYQLEYMRIPAHAAVSETVTATNALGKQWAKGLVNGILRTFQREQESLAAEVAKDEEASCAHPRWLLERLKTAWPEQWRTIMEANNNRPPMSLRVNQCATNRDSYLQSLANTELAAHPAPYATEGITLEQAVAVERLPGFEQGMVSVQDTAAQLAPGLMALQPGHRILDACAAPGGKTCHLLESCPDIDLYALDQDPERLTRVEENLARLSLNATLITADAGEPGQWWDGKPFDRILLDAPCSATGVIRRHPDIKLLRQTDDIDKLVQQQQKLL
ncbi:MAG: 16S rRNA (cytosine(967)-C(5))-methyltransferase RsmB, partial [Gammaproteobacteria bacterium]|nr:16S rRNA (cytosine(967)-C(5))-methyltransferase RsmB [Gammaproteobacteria bacterium]